MGSEPNEAKIVTHIILGVIGLIFLLSLVFGSFGVVDAGERGVKVRLGNVVGVIEPGFYMKTPFIEKVEKIDVKTRSVTYEREEPLDSASRDLQDVRIATVVNYHVDPLQVRDVYVNYGDQDNYEAQVVRPAVRDIVKATASQFTAEELVTRRADFTSSVLTQINARLQTRFSIVEQVNITNFEFSESFSAAIEAKVTAVQHAEAAKNKLEQVKFEAQQTIETARATAEAQRISSAALAAQGGEDYVNLKWIEKWDGKLPAQFIPGQTLPMLNLRP